MTDTLQPYPEYKDSGQTWLGSVPCHWPVLPNRAIFDEVKDREHPEEEMLSVTITRGIVRQKALLADSSKKDSSNLNKSAYKLVQPRDIAYNKMRAWQGAIAASELRGIISPAYVVMRLREDANLPRYFHHLYRTPLFAKEAERWSYGITSDMWSLRPEHFKVIYTPLPPPDEQAAIMRFLDHANGRIERAIRAKRKIITLLTEQKQAIIASLVTGKCEERRVKGEEGRVKGEVRRVKGEGGSDLSLFTPRPSHFMKPSGIPWLGDIPNHWNVYKIKHCVTPIEQGWSPQCDGQQAHENEWGVLKVGCVNKDSFNPEQNKKLPEYLKADVSLEIHEGDILVSRANTRELLGLAAVADKPRSKLLLCDKLFRFRTRPECANAKFMVLALRSKPSRVQIESSTNGASSSMQNIGQGVIKNLQLSMPDVSEQERIVAYLKEELGPLTTAISNFEREITLLREYRTRLTADVVTGKLDVRTAAVSIPDPEPVESVPSFFPDDPDASDDTEPEET